MLVSGQDLKNLDRQVTDWNWNEHYAEVEFSEDVQVRFLIRLAEDTELENEGQKEYSVQSIEVLEASLNENL